MKKLLTPFLLLLFTLLSASNASAGGSTCEPIYGGGNVCPPATSFTLEKMVKRPGDGQFVKSLTPNDPKYAPYTDIIFQITLRNTGKDRLNNVKIVDSLPPYTTFSSGPGAFDGMKRTVTWTVASLDSGKSQTFVVIAKTAQDVLIPANGVCPTNEVKAVDQSRASAADTTQFCIDKQLKAGLPASATLKSPPPPLLAQVPLKNAPNTGPEMLPLLALIPSGALGLFLKRKAN